MKKIRNSILLAAVATMILTQCSKGDRIRNGFFYTTMKSNEAELTLFVDGANKGQLPYIDTAAAGRPQFGVDSTTRKCLSLQVSDGKHILEARDKNGVVKSSSTMKNKDTWFEESSSLSSGVGGSSVCVNKTCVIGNLFY